MADDPTQFSSPTNITWHGDVGTVEYGGGDRSLVVFFYNKAMPNPAKSREHGRPYFDNVTYVRIAPPGEKLNIVDRPARGEDARRFPMQWSQFEKNAEQIPEGTSIDLLYPENPAISATLRACGVHTVEQCAEMSAHALDSVGMGSQQWQNDARKYLELSNKGVKASQYRQDIEALNKENSFLKKQLENLTATVQQMKNQELVRADLAMQTLVATNMPRPTHQRDVSFDPQSAMINATGQATRPPTAQKPMRQRSRLRG